MTILILLLILCCGAIAGGVFAFRRSRSVLRWVLICGASLVVVFLGMLAVLAFGLAHSNHEAGVALASVEWLDARASDISFYRANDFSGVFAYEFHIGKNDFAGLAKDRGWHMVPLTNNRSVLRYTYFLPEADSRRRQPLSVELESGLVYDTHRPNGAGISVLYDTNTLRAYVVQSSR